MDPLGLAVTRYFELRAGLARSLGSRSKNGDKLAAELVENGVLVLDNILPMPALRRLSERAACLNLTDPEQLVYSPNGRDLFEAANASRELLEKFYFLHIKNYQDRTNPYDELLEYVAPILRDYYGSNYYVRDIYCYRTQPIAVVQGSYQWHVDNYPAGSLKVMVYLTDVGDGDGPLSVALKSHAGFRAELGHVGARFEDDFVRSRFQIRECYAPAGSMIIFNNNAIHRAVDPVKGHRDVINFTIFPCVLGLRPRVRGLDLKQEKGLLKKYTR